MWVYVRVCVFISVYSNFLSSNTTLIVVWTMVILYFVFKISVAHFSIYIISYCVSTGDITSLYNRFSSLLILKM